MALSTKIIKKRIRSIGNTKKITKAMEMVAATKMRKAINAALSSRAYALAAWGMVINLVGRINVKKHPLLKSFGPVKKIGIILISSNRGLCGGFNNQIINSALRLTENQTGAGSGVEVEWIALGKNGAEFLARNGRKIVAEFEKLDVISGEAAVSALTKMVIKNYCQGVYGKIFVAYTDFKSALIQKPKIKQILPLEPTPDTDLGSVSANEQPLVLEKFEYIFEPRPDAVLDQFLPHLVEFQLYQALLESTASEHSARMMAMKNASNAASDMIDDLTLAFNQARQAAITREIAEISGGKAALEIN